MLSKVKQAIFLRRIKKMLSRYQIKVIHFIPGRVRLSSPYWAGNSKIINQLMPILQTEVHIQSVKHTPETGTLLVEYHSDPNVTEEQMEDWFHTVQQIHNDVISKEVTKL